MLQLTSIVPLGVPSLFHKYVPVKELQLAAKNNVPSTATVPPGQSPPPAPISHWRTSVVPTPVPSLRHSAAPGPVLSATTKNRVSRAAVSRPRPEELTPAGM